MQKYVSRQGDQIKTETLWEITKIWIYYQSLNFPFEWFIKDEINVLDDCSG